MRNIVLLIVIALLARLGLLWIADGRYSFDLRAWVDIAQMMHEGRNPYVEQAATGYISWAPFWIQVIYTLSSLSQKLGIELWALFTAFFLCIESVLIAVLYWQLAQAVRPKSAFRYALLGIALNPVAMLQTTVHGNFDVLIGLLLLLFVVFQYQFLARGHAEDYLLSSLAAGVGMLAKTIPVVAFPLLLIGWRRTRFRSLVLAALLAGGPFLLAFSAVYVLFPEFVWERVVRYRSIPGYFGTTGILSATGLGGLSQHRILFILGMAGTMIWMGYRAATLAQPSGRFVLFGTTVLVLFIPVAGPGYGPQYVYWFLPLLILCHPHMTALGQRVLEGTLLIAIPTFAVEYSLFSSHGALLLHYVDTQSLQRAASAIGTQTGQTLLRLPMFGGLLATLIVCWRQLQAEVRGSRG